MSVWLDWIKSSIGISFAAAVGHPLLVGSNLKSRVEERQRRLPCCLYFCTGSQWPDSESDGEENESTALSPVEPVEQPSPRTIELQEFRTSFGPGAMSLREALGDLEQKGDSSDEEEAPEAVPISGNDIEAVQAPPPVNQKPQEASPKEHDHKPVPVTLITGYLGSGKTTLVNHILTAPHGYRIAVIMNEFGSEVGIESALVKEPEAGKAKPMVEEWVELSNGCLCCSVKDNFVQALEALMGKRDKFDYILIETTGLANPGPVATALWTDPELEAGVCLDAIVTVVDAHNIGRQMKESRPCGSVNEAQQQIAYADVVVINKVDLVGEGELFSLREEILSINAGARILCTSRSRIDLGEVLGIEAYNGTKAVEGTACAEGRSDHVHDSGVSTVSLRAAGHVDLERFKCWLDGILWEEDQATRDIFRMKGLLNVEGSGRKHVFQVRRTTDSPGPVDGFRPVASPQARSWSWSRSAPTPRNPKSV
mmetsp:Transcript_16881/g.40239  ORF Transcript_16881/g.40239 Transcript_16881/m.40239 type:complete len:482 (-) Transcript_16881:583-2028(-)